jgi:hypothetical protein
LGKLCHGPNKQDTGTSPPFQPAAEDSNKYEDLKMDGKDSEPCGTGRSSKTSENADHDHDSPTPEILYSRRSSQPVQEFDGSDHAMIQSFPYIFMLGRAYGRSSGKLSKAQLQHVLLQFTLAAAQDRVFLGYHFDSMTRHETLSGVVAHVKGNPSAVSKMTALIESLEKDPTILKLL